jgi:hypothetical protein
MLDFNGFRLAFSSPTCTAHQQPMPDNKQLRPLRERLGADWFLYWDDGTVFGLPREEGAPQLGDQVELEADQHLKLLMGRGTGPAPSPPGRCRRELAPNQHQVVRALSPSHRP